MQPCRGRECPGKHAHGAVLPGCGCPAARLRPGRQPRPPSWRNTHRSVRRRGPAARAGLAVGRRPRSRALQLGRSGRRQRGQGTRWRHRPWPRRLVAAAGQRARHRGARLHPHRGRVPDRDARHGPARGRALLGADLQPRQQPGSGQPAAAGESGRRSSGGVDHRHRRPRQIGRSGDGDGRRELIEHVHVGGARIRRVGAARAPGRRRGEVAVVPGRGRRTGGDESAAQPLGPPDQPLDGAGGRLERPMHRCVRIRSGCSRRHRIGRAGGDSCG